MGCNANRTVVFDQDNGIVFDFQLGHIAVVLAQASQGLKAFLTFGMLFKLGRITLEERVLAHVNEFVDAFITK